MTRYSIACIHKLPTRRYPHVLISLLPQQIINLLVHIANMQDALRIPILMHPSSRSEPILCAQGALNGRPGNVYVLNARFISSLGGHDTYSDLDSATAALYRTERLNKSLKVDLRSLHWMLVPMHLDGHWTLIVFDFRKRQGK